MPLAPNCRRSWMFAGMACAVSYGVPDRAADTDGNGIICGYVIVPAGNPLAGVEVPECDRRFLPFNRVLAPLSVDYGRPFGEGGWLYGFQNWINPARHNRSPFTVDEMSTRVEALAEALAEA